MGFGQSEIITTLVLTIASGVASQLIATTIYDKLMKKGEHKLVIEKQITISTKEELVQYIEKVYQEK